MRYLWYVRIRIIVGYVAIYCEVFWIVCHELGNVSQVMKLKKNIYLQIPRKKITNYFVSDLITRSEVTKLNKNVICFTIIVFLGQEQPI